MTFYIILTSLFYFSYLLIGIVCEIPSVGDPEQEQQRRQARTFYVEASKEQKEKLEKPSYLTEALYLVMTLIGFFTSQWFLFLTLFLFGLIPKQKKALIFIDGIVSLILIVFIVVNKYHLHYNITEYLLSLT